MEGKRKGGRIWYICVSKATTQNKQAQSGQQSATIADYRILQMTFVR
jgi:hypothetical protein